MNCKGKICKEKCDACNKMGLGCCAVPVMTEEEVARIMSKHVDLINDGKLFIVRFGKDAFCVIPENLSKKSPINISEIIDKPCVFFDDKTFSCKIYEDRPKMCRDFGVDERLTCIVKDYEIDEINNLDNNKDMLKEIVSKQVEFANKAGDYFSDHFPNFGNQIGLTNNFKNFMTIPDYSGKKMRELLKNSRENTIIYLIQNMLYSHLDDLMENGNTDFAETKYISVKNKYKLFIEKVGKDKKITSLPIKYYYTDIPELKPLVTMYNRMYMKFFMFPSNVLDILTNRAQSAVNGSVKSIDCLKDNNIEKDDDLGVIVYMLLSTMLFKTYKTDYKFKSKFWNNLTIKNDELMDIIKYLTKELKIKIGLEPTFDFSDFRNGVLGCMLDANDKLFKALMRLK